MPRFPDFRLTIAARLCKVALLAGVLLNTDVPLASGELNKGHRILIERGLQVQGMVANYDTFSLDRYKQANYTAIHWIWNSNVALHGAAPGFPWARWVHDPDQMPGAGEQPYLSQLVALQLGDEQHLNDIDVRNEVVDWFDDIRHQWPNTILYVNSYGGQVSDAALSDFIARARPDMLCFDTYPFRSDYNTQEPNQPAHGSPTNWYGELRRYRVHALNAAVPLAVYRQTFHAVQDYDQTVYREPSPSEMNLNTFAALAFGATKLIDFTYNTGASSLFTPPGGDSNPKPAYFQQADINHRARNLGKALVHLTALDSAPNGADPTMDIVFLRGHTGPNVTDRTPLPIGFEPHPALPNMMSGWTFQRNDPHIVGFGAVTNLGTKNDGLRGDVIISWFKPLDSDLDDPAAADDQVYFMVVNALTGHEGTAADYRQRIVINFENTVPPSLQRLGSETGEVEIVNLPVINAQGRRRLTIELDGGMGELFKFNTGHGFVGTSMALSGDFNGDGVVDALDYVVWRKGLGTVFDHNAFDVWKRNLGAVSETAAESHARFAVPEPGTCWLLAMAALVCSCRWRSRAVPNSLLNAPHGRAAR